MTTQYGLRNNCGAAEQLCGEGFSIATPRRLDEQHNITSDSCESMISRLHVMASPHADLQRRTIYLGMVPFRGLQPRPEHDQRHY